MFSTIKGKNMDCFTLSLLNEILKDLYTYENNNTDFERLGCPPKSFHPNAS